MLYVLCGIPGSGKSTWAMDHLGSLGVKMVSTDGIRDELFGGGFDRSTNFRVFRTAYDRVEEELAKGNRVCYDATNILPRDRRTVILIAKRLDVPAIAVDFGNDAERSIRMDALRERHVPEGTIRSMASRYVNPKPKEGFKQVWVVLAGE